MVSAGPDAIIWSKSQDTFPFIGGVASLCLSWCAPRAAPPGRLARPERCAPRAAGRQLRAAAGCPRRAARPLASGSARPGLIRRRACLPPGSHASPRAGSSPPCWARCWPQSSSSCCACWCCATRTPTSAPSTCCRVSAACARGCMRSARCASQHQRPPPHPSHAAPASLLPSSFPPVFVFATFFMISVRPRSARDGLGLVPGPPRRRAAARGVARAPAARRPSAPLPTPLSPFTPSQSHPLHPPQIFVIKEGGSRFNWEDTPYSKAAWIAAIVGAGTALISIGWQVRARPPGARFSPRAFRAAAAAAAPGLLGWGARPAPARLPRTIPPSLLHSTPPWLASCSPADLGGQAPRG